MNQIADDESRSDAPPSKWRLFLAGARRGARFGALVMLAIWAAIGLFVVVAWSIASIRRQTFRITWEVIQAMAGFSGSTLLAMIYGAMAGALIMGVAGMLSAPPEDAQRQR
jgi:hypothetical protein